MLHFKVGADYARHDLQKVAMNLSAGMAARKVSSMATGKVAARKVSYQTEGMTAGKYLGLFKRFQADRTIGNSRHCSKILV